MDNLKIKRPDMFTGLCTQRDISLKVTGPLTWTILYLEVDVQLSVLQEQLRVVNQLLATWTES